MNRPRSRTTIVALLGVTLLFAVGAPETLVLCVGSDGHAAIELLATGGCGDCAEPTGLVPAHEAGGRLHESDHCGPCVDMLLLQYIVRKTDGRATERIDRADVDLSAPPPAATTGRRPFVSVHRDVLTRAIAREATRSVVLLI